MDSDTAAAMLEERAERSSEALAIEVMQARAILGSIEEALEDMRVHIIAVTDKESEHALIRAAGGLAVVQLLDDWLLTAMAALNETAVKAAAEYPAP